MPGMDDWTARINPQVHLAWSGAWSSDTVEPPRILVDHELVIVAKGRCLVVIDGQAHELGAGGFIIVPPGRVHHSRALAGGCTRHCLHFDWEWRDGAYAGPWYGFVSGRLPEVPPRATPAWVPVAMLAGTAPAAALGASQRLLVQWRNGEHGGVRALALELLLALYVRPGQPPPADRSAVLARLVKARLDRGGLEALALRAELRRLGHSYEHLCRAFTRTYGIPPLRYVLLARIERAKVLLQEPGASVAGVAQSLGYRDAKHFARLFRSFTGGSLKRKS
jgi:AraC-like DNA-binding protein